MRWRGFMRKIIVFENISLDGYFAGPNGETDLVRSASR
jgi:hypothetical protein